MSRCTKAVPLILAAAALAAPLQARAQTKTGGKLEPTTSSADARAAYRAAVDDVNNVHPTRAVANARKAVSADPNFGLARSLLAVLATDLTPAQQEEELNRGVADAARATTGELLLAAATRANALGRVEETRVLTDALVALLPNDPEVAFFRSGTLPPDEGQEAVNQIARRFPDYAPAQNLLAYQLWTAGDRAGALEAVQRYVRLAPSHPNSHDSYAELLQFAGRYDEALPHYEQAVKLDPSYNVGYAGVAEIHVLLGHGAPARAAYAQAAEHSATPAAKMANLAAGATTFIVDGKPKDAIRELSALATRAEQENLKPQAAGIHRAVALIEASMGDRRAVASHITTAAELGGADAAVQHRFTAMAYTLAGQLDLARAAAAKFDAAAAAGTAAQRANAREVNAVLAVADKDLAKAKAELAQAGPSLFGKAILAEALKKSGDRAGAQALKQEILSTGVAPTVFDIIARAKAAKI
jgi:tetratricopeptide (TPR) repeat protein